ncbi:MAG: matrixin family metalloprotease [Myxococcota bacterium]
MQRPLVCLVAVVLLGATCEDREPSLVLPDDAEIVVEDGVTIVRTGLENPPLRAFYRADLNDYDLERMLSPLPAFDEVESYFGPAAPRFAVEGQGTQYGWLDIDRSDLDLEAVFRAAGPGVSLPMGGASVRVRYEDARSTTSGLVATPIDEQRFALDPQVLVVPVRARVFAAADGTLPYLGTPSDAQALIAQLIDPAEATGSIFGNGTDRVRVAAFTWTQFPGAVPDLLWRQCGIQFHLDDFDVVPQSNGLEVEVVNSATPCNSIGGSTLQSFMAPTLRAEGAIPIFFGGDVDAGLSADFFGVTCPPISPVAFVAIDTSSFDTRGVVAHELGHFLGLNHVTSRDNLMATPSRVTREIAGTELTAAQCERARCEAAKLLHSWNRIDDARRQTECATFEPVCGNNVVEDMEECDEPGNGCRADCTRERCGDGILDPGEECEPVTDPQNCTFECEVCPGCSMCGNGVVDPGEECDPPDGVTCDAMCLFTFG